MVNVTKYIGILEHMHGVISTAAVPEPFFYLQDDMVHVVMPLA